MLMNRLAAQQEFLPTDLIAEAPFWHYALFAFMLLIGILWMIPAKREGEEDNPAVGGLGAIFTVAGGFMLCLTIFAGDVPDNKQNHENLKTNIQAVYNVDDVIRVDRELHNGDRIKITSDGITSEVIANWDPETYEPTLSPVAVQIEDLEALKK